MWLLPPLLLFLIPGSSDLSAAIMGPGEVRSPEGGSLTMQCRYDPGWEPYVKYWCRGADWNLCKILVRTTGSQWEVKEDRVSIRDNQTSHTFTVTMEKLRRADADTYWCAIERRGLDPGIAVKVTIDPVPVTTGAPASSPTVSGLHPDGGSLLSSVHFLLLVFLKLPLFLSMLGTVLWVNRPQRCSAAGGAPPHSENQ